MVPIEDLQQSECESKLQCQVSPQLGHSTPDLSSAPQTRQHFGDRSRLGPQPKHGAGRASPLPGRLCHRTGFCVRPRPFTSVVSFHAVSNVIGVHCCRRHAQSLVVLAQCPSQSQRLNRQFRCAMIRQAMDEKSIAHQLLVELLVYGRLLSLPSLCGT